LIAEILISRRCNLTPAGKTPETGADPYGMMHVDVP
jgi:hypothetical protein